MRSPAFWWEDRSLAGALLAPLGHAYGAITARRMARPGHRARVPVICVGNLVAGGAGKTPLVAAVADTLRAGGKLPVILSRGYGGALAGPALVDATHHKARDVGDEPLILTRHAPVVVSRDRKQGADFATLADADTIVMDDGLQNPSLVKDLAFAVVDAASGVGNGHCIPAGPLRAPLSAQWPHVHALVLVGSGAPGEAVAAEALRHGIAVLRARLVPDSAAAERVAGRDVLAFAGIGRPEKFFQTLTQAGAAIAIRRPFPDHHPFTDEDLCLILAQASGKGLIVATTEKDAARLPRWFLDEAWERLVVLPVTMAFDDPAGFETLLGSVPARFSVSRALP